MLSWPIRNVDSSKTQDTVIVLGIFAPLVFFRLFLLANSKIPMGHDTLQYLQLEYTFFNEAALHGGLPQWMPFMTQGTISNFWVMISEGIIPLVLVPLAPLLKGVNFLYIFEAGILFDEFILVLGCFLVAKRFLKTTYSIAFLTTSITYTAVSAVQIWWNFHLFYLIPLILYAFDKGIRNVSAKYLFMAVILSSSTLLGNLPYFAPVFAFILLTFAIVIIIAAPNELKLVARNFISKISIRHAFAVIVPLCFVGLIGLWYLNWQNSVVQYNIGRSAAGQSSLTEFLVYAGYVGFPKFVEFVSRYSNNLDNVIYGGLLVVPFTIVAMIKVRSKISYAFGATALILASLSAGTYVSALFYYFFPLGNLFREIGLIGSLVKVFLVVYAAFGFEAFVVALKERANSNSTASASDKSVLVIPLVTVAAIVAVAALTISGTVKLFTYPPWIVPTSDQLFVTPSEIYQGLLILITLGLAYLCTLFSTVFSRRGVKVFLVLLLILSVADVYSLNIQLEYSQVPRVSQGVVNLFDIYNYSFQMQRNQDYYSNARFVTIAPFILGGPTGGNVLPDNGTQPYSTIGKWGALYWNTESFLYFDSEASVFRTDSLLNSTNAFYTLFVPPSQISSRHVGFPIPDSPVYQKLSGYTMPKLQLFTAINVLPAYSDVANTLQSPSDNGDMLFATANAAPWSQITGPIVRLNSSSVQFTNERFNATSIQIQEFSFDTLKVLIDTGSNSSSILYYADSWSPNWHAYVNGSQTTVIQTNIGYKSIVIPPGTSSVYFVYNDNLSQLVIYSVEILGLLAFLIVIYLFLEDVCGVRLSPRRFSGYA